MVNVQTLAQCMAHSKLSINATCYSYFTVLLIIISVSDEEKKRKQKVFPPFAES